MKNSPLNDTNGTKEQSHFSNSSDGDLSGEADNLNVSSIIIQEDEFATEIDTPETDRALTKSQDIRNKMDVRPKLRVAQRF